MLLNMTIREVTLGYWSTKGLGSVSRMIILYAGVKLIAKIYKLLPKEEKGIITFDGSSWHEKDKVLLKNKNSLINLPYLHLYKDKDEILISHSTTILGFLGKEFGMFGQDRREELQCEQLLQETDDLRKVITSFAYIHHKIKEDEIIGAKEVFNKAFEKTNVGKIQKFEHWFSSKNITNENIFLVGNKISSPDFNLFDILDLYVEFIKHYKFLDDPIDENIFEKLGYPYVSKFYNNLKKLPKMQKYLNSQLYKLPYTNKSANFGSGIKGNTWDHKNQIDETPKELIIS